MAAGFGLRASLIVVLAVLTAGCPMATGRTRGTPSPGPDGGTNCTSSTAPQPNQPCLRPGDVCDAIRVCTGLPGSSRIDTCECRNGLWSCTEGRCSNPPEDAGNVTCPPFTINDGDPCSARQGGLYCSSTAPGCGSTGSVTVPCWCTGSRWSCQAPNCRDDGPDGNGGLCPTQRLHTGDACTVGIRNLTCDSASTDCQGFTVAVPCTCDGATWSCTVPECDAGTAFDAGADAAVSCPATAPMPGFACVSGLECRYRAGGTCVAYCYCPSGRFVCETINCGDGGLADASLATDARPDGSVGIDR